MNSTQETALSLDLADEDLQSDELLHALQEKFVGDVNKIISDVTNMLLAQDQEADVSQAENTNLASIRLESRRRLDYANHCRALAKELVIGALINSDNEAWDPLDPSTHRDPGEHAWFRELLQA